MGLKQKGEFTMTLRRMTKWFGGIALGFVVAVGQIMAFAPTGKPR